MIWRIVASPHMAVSPREVRSWSLWEVVEAHMALDAVDEMQQAALKRR